MRTALLPLLLAAGLASGCGGDDPSATPTAGESTASPSAGPSPSRAPSPTGSSSAADAVGEDEQVPAAVDEQAFAADRAQDTAEASGNGLSVVDVELAGDATLAVTLMGVGYPSDTGVEEYAGPRRQSPALPVVRELQLGGVFEGYDDAFVGVAQERPFRVFRLSDPQRVVLDVAHSG